MKYATAWCFLLAASSPSGLIPLGTGFALGDRKIATALHVVGVEPKDIYAVIVEHDPRGYQDTTVNSTRLFFPVQVIYADSVHDLAILEFEPNVESTVSYGIGGTDEVESGHAVVTLGFPHADVGRFVLTRQEASVGAKILLANQGIKSKYLVLNTLLRPGQSGGPVFDARTGRVVAVLVGAFVPDAAKGIVMIGNVDPAALHQTTHAISAEYVMEMLS